MEIRFLDPKLKDIFKPATELAGGFDLRSTVDASIYPGDTIKIPTGVAIHMMDSQCTETRIDQKHMGFHTMIPCAVIMPRSGLGCKGIRPYNTPGLIDADYQGEIIICLHNGSDDIFKVKQYDRIAQLVFMFAMHPIMTLVDQFTVNTTRGNNGFGSTGAQQGKLPYRACYSGAPYASLNSGDCAVVVQFKCGQTTYCNIQEK